MATEPKTLINLDQKERKIIRRALSKMEASVSRNLTVNQKDENELGASQCKQDLADIAALKVKMA